MTLEEIAKKMCAKGKGILAADESTGTIAKRFKRMIDTGMIEEVEGILERKGMSANSQSMKSVGYRQVCEYLAGDYSLDDMIDRGINSTRQLAKRQMTWMRSWDNMIFLENNSSLFSSVKDLILKNS